MPLLHAPQMVSVPFPSPNSAIALVYHRLTGKTYPLNILVALTSTQRIAVQPIALISPDHVHIPTAHIGTLHGSFTGQCITALDVFLFLQYIAVNPLDLCFLSCRFMRTHVKAAFNQWLVASQGVRYVACEEFVPGQHIAGSPLRIDLFLGNTGVWGFESCSMEG
ncbi:hypothetical protein P691DRAFT_739804 [Macrolepiota fuliginosa MF-IS2]|uniref:Uncharacterized protein n=1 Tax=Macrolepiota fuliginosa MF-IS2 TaxID=1400762 RepID=A0A9P5X0W9_9AGAR|nr:hypothetical protein P691DRAFT_739804 [Macrolepiota fuliginosa MF-IS2]